MPPLETVPTASYLHSHVRRLSDRDIAVLKLEAEEPLKELPDIFEVMNAEFPHTAEGRTQRILQLRRFDAQCRHNDRVLRNKSELKLKIEREYELRARDAQRLIALKRAFEREKELKAQEQALKAAEAQAAKERRDAEALRQRQQQAQAALMDERMVSLNARVVAPKVKSSDANKDRA